jgi:hypothetical protein
LIRQQPVISQHPSNAYWNNFVGTSDQFKTNEVKQRTAEFSDEPRNNNFQSDQIFSELSSALEENCELKDQLKRLKDAL